mmetsp:Transcript_2207/g.5885  ORF Transcript_2207/g.5885 Transcript_2207/m.5885 type:complete len:342 (+) Transcript_2207:165-1190(+)
MNAAADPEYEEQSLPVVSDRLELLKRGICRVELPEGFDTNHWAEELSQIRPMNLCFEGDGESPLYRNIMEEPEFPFDLILCGGGGGDDDDDNDGDMGENLPTEQRFLPQRSYRESRRHPKPSESEDSFISKYAHKPRTGRPTNRPRFLVGLAQQRARAASTENDHDPSAIPPSHTPKHPKPTSEHNPLTEVPMSSFGGNVVDAEQVFEDFTTRSSQAGHHHANANAAANDYQHQLEEDLRTESIQLATTLMASNELDSVQQMEKRMVEITTLIGQFSNLVQEQQEQVLQVHDSAKETKDNLDKGQENLIDAAERTKQSKHYKAWAILAMTGILAFFHILRG